MDETDICFVVEGLQNRCLCRFLRQIKSIRLDSFEQTVNKITGINGKAKGGK